MTFADLGRRLAERWPDRDPAALVQGVRAWVPLVQTPPRGLWSRSGPIAHMDAEAWLGRLVATDPDPAPVVLRYLAAFGPASVADAQTWSGLTRLREVVDRLRPGLVTFRDGRGVDLFDLPDAPRPDPETPAPPRFLYDYDNLLLSHADRSRVVTDAYRRQEFPADGPMPRLVLLDGLTAGVWTTETARGATTLAIRPFASLVPADETALIDEGAGLLAMLAPDARHDIRVLPPATT